MNTADLTRLLAIIPIGKANRITALQIATQLGYETSNQQVETRQLIEYAISQGHLIVSDNRVYWITSNKGEVENYIQSLESRANETQNRADEIKNEWNSQNPNNQIP
jgi:cell division septum initiation protein DivIVA